MEWRKRNNEIHQLQQTLINEAKDYIASNYQRVTDWYKLNITIVNGNNENNKNKLKIGEYVSEVEKQSRIDFTKGLMGDDFVTEDSPDYLGSIVSLTDVILDETDYDLSLTINGLEWWWIDDAAVIELAHFVEQELDRGNKILKLLNNAQS